MKNRIRERKNMLQEASVILLLSLSLSVPGRTQTPSWENIEQVLGSKGMVQDGVIKLTFPRSDLHVNIGNIRVETGLALTSWLAFLSMGDRAMMMGDLVLLESEVPSVEKSLLAHDIRISALHNHLIGENPKVMYMHVGGEGDALKLAEGMNAVFAQTATPLMQKPQGASQPALTWASVETIMGRTGKHNGIILQFNVPRNEKISEHGMEIPSFMGMASVVNIQYVDEKTAATTGDFVLVPAEVDSVSEALIGNGFAVTAIHSHMLFESPRLIFLHFWKVDAPEAIARGLRIALDKTNSSR